MDIPRTSGFFRAKTCPGVHEVYRCRGEAGLHWHGAQDAQVMVETGAISGCRLMIFIGLLP